MELRIREHQPLTLSKAEAAARQVEGAIGAVVKLAPGRSSAPIQAFSHWWAEYAETLN
jgi:hypothetical protein